jgi:hypothetical protein
MLPASFIFEVKEMNLPGKPKFLMALLPDSNKMHQQNILSAC